MLQDATEEYMGNLAVYPGSHSGEIKFVYPSISCFIIAYV